MSAVKPALDIYMVAHFFDWKVYHLCTLLMFSCSTIDSVVWMLHPVICWSLYSEYSD